MSDDLDEQKRSRSHPRPFTGRGQWMDRPETPENFEERVERLDAYLRGLNVALPRDYVEGLAWCRNGAELTFMRRLITLPGWRREGERSFGNGLFRFTIREYVESFLIPILFEDHLNELRYVLDIRTKTEYLPGKLWARRRRIAAIERTGVKYLEIPGLKAREYANSLQRDLARYQVKAVAELPELQARIQDPDRLRFWTKWDLQYDGSSLDREERRRVMKSWLEARGRKLTNEEADWLVHCERAAEVWFGLQLLSFEDRKFDGRAVHIHGLYRIVVQEIVCGQQVDFLIEPISRRAICARSVIQINAPSHHPRDVRADNTSDAVLKEAGYQLYRESADRGKFLGHTWLTKILADVTRP